MTSQERALALRALDFAASCEPDEGGFLRPADRALLRAFAERDVSREARDAHGRWTAGGAEPAADQHAQADRLAGDVAGRGILGRLGAAGRWLKQKTKQVYVALERRYGRGQAVAIFAAGHVVGLGVPGFNLVPGSTLVGMAPFAALAEVYLQARRALGKLRSHADFAELLTDDQVNALARGLLQYLARLWNRRTVQRFAEFDAGQHPRDEHGRFARKAAHQAARQHLRQAFRLWNRGGGPVDPEHAAAREIDPLFSDTYLSWHGSGHRDTRWNLLGLRKLLGAIERHAPSVEGKAATVLQAMRPHVQAAHDTLVPHDPGPGYDDWDVEPGTPYQSHAEPYSTFGGHDVSGEARDRRGRWTTGGGSAASPAGAPPGGRGLAKRIGQLLPRAEEIGRLALSAEETLEARKLANRLDHRLEQVVHLALGGDAAGWTHTGPTNAAADVRGVVRHRRGKALDVGIDCKLVTAADQRVGVAHASRRRKVQEMAEGTIVARLAVNLSPAAGQSERGVYLALGTAGFAARPGQRGVQKILTHAEYLRLTRPGGAAILRERVTEALQAIDLKEYRRMSSEQAKQGMASDLKNAATSIESARKLGLSTDEAARQVAASLPPDVLQALLRQQAVGE